MSVIFLLKQETNGECIIWGRKAKFVQVISSSKLYTMIQCTWSRLSTKRTTGRRRRASCWPAGFGAWQDISIMSLSFFSPCLGGVCSSSIVLDQLFLAFPHSATASFPLPTLGSYWSCWFTGLQKSTSSMQTLFFQGFPRRREMLGEVRGGLEDLLWPGSKNLISRLTTK